MAKIVYIADVCKEIFAGGDVPKSALSYEKTAEYNVPIFSNGEKNCGLYGYTNNARVKEPSITVSARGTIGYTAIRTEPFVPVVRLITLTPKSEVIDLDYLFYATQNYKFEGSGTSIPQLTVPMLKKYAFPLPKPEEQKAIAKLFQKLDCLITLRKRQLTKLDELVKARFFEMFGEISDNSMNWDCFTIGKLISTIESGWSGNGKQREKHADEIAVLKVSAVTKGYFIPTECKVLDDQHNIKKYVYPQKGDILFSRANTKEMVGATVLIKKDYPDLILPDKLWKIRFCTDVNPIYMKHVLSTTTVRNAFSAASTGTSGSMYNVSMEKFKGVIIPVPPLSVQNEFAAFVERVDQQKQTAQQSLEKLELMKKALMQEYFG